MNWQQQLTGLQINSKTEMVELYKMGTPPICAIVKGESTKEKGVAVFAALILSLVKYYGGDWNKEQIMDCAATCYDEWYYITFAEMGHFAKRVKSGYFGKMYGLFTPAILIDWLSSYISETDEKRALFYANAPAEWQEPANPVPPEKIQELVKELEHDLLIQKADEEIESQKKRADAIDKYNRMLKRQAEFLKDAGGKTTNQVPDQNNIPGLTD